MCKSNHSECSCPLILVLHHSEHLFFSGQPRIRIHCGNLFWPTAPLVTSKMNLTRIQPRHHCQASKEGMDFPNTRGLAIVDAISNTGSLFEGFITASQNLNVPLLYVCLAQDDQHLEWFHTFWVEELTRLFQQGQLVVPNFDRSGLYQM